MVRVCYITTNKACRMKSSRKLATFMVAILTAGLFVLGVQMLTLPKITLFSHWPYYMLPKGPIILILSVLLAWFHKPAARFLMWLGRKIHRWLSMLLMVAALGADGLLHLFSIPHVEGWWLPLLGSSAAASAIHALLHTHKNKNPQQVDES
jgi:hypothetical protein